MYLLRKLKCLLNCDWLVFLYFYLQLPVHPVNDEYVQYILSLAFRHFKQRDSYTASPAAANGEIIAALYAEVLGVLAYACFPPVRKRFIAEFKEHQNNPSSFVNIIYGMKYLRIKVCTFLCVHNKLIPGLCSTGAQSPLATFFSFWATRK